MRRLVPAGLLLASVSFLAACSTSPLVWSNGTQEITGVYGDRHCETQNVQFLNLDGSQFAMDPEHQMPADAIDGTFESDATLPAVATDSGFRSGTKELWQVPDASAIYVVGAKATERWPAVAPNYGCD